MIFKSVDSNGSCWDGFVRKCGHNVPQFIEENRHTVVNMLLNTGEITEVCYYINIRGFKLK